MKIRKFVSLAMLATGLAATAAPITPEQALQRAAGNGPARLAPNKSLSLAYTQKLASGMPAAYVFAVEGAEGFRVLSADDCAVPVLGYSDSGRFDADNMPDAMKWWLAEYGRMMEYAAKKGVSTYKAPAKENGVVVAPLLTTKWDQSAPYNDDCPMLDNQRTVTGCVATSMAQVLNFHKWPEVGQGGIKYDWANGGKRLMYNFAKFVPAWDKMLDVYDANSPAENKAAVAELMMACGYSMEMNYSYIASGATSYKLQNSLVEYFNFDPVAAISTAAVSLPMHGST